VALDIIVCCVLPLFVLQLLSAMYPWRLTMDILDEGHKPNNETKNNRTRVVAALLGFLLIASVTTFAYGNYQYQSALAQQSSQQNSNATTISNTTSTNTFTAKGILAGVTGQQQQHGGSSSNNQSSAPNSGKPFLVGGQWQMQAKNGNITNFRANFTMVRTDGSEHHSIDIANFKVGNNTNFKLDPKGKTTINGTADYSINGTSKWPGTDTTITIEKGTILTIQPNEQEAKQHFQGQPIYGIALTITGENGAKIIQSAPAGGNQTQNNGGNNLLDQLKKPFEGLFGGNKTK